MVRVITSIELANWKTHKSTKLEFSKGTNIIIGQMGAGKSSIMDAVSFALFGTFPSIQHRKTNISYLIRSKPRQEDKATIRLSFEVNGHSYEVERNISQNSPSSATLKRDGTYLQSQPQRVTEEIEKALKIDYDLFSRAVYSQQNSLDYFLNLRSSDRKREIDNLLGLDKFSTSKENITTLINKIKDMINEDQRNVNEFESDKIKEQAVQLESESKKYREMALASEKKLHDSKAMLASAEGRFKSANSEMNAKNLMSQEIKSLRGKAETFESEMKKIDKRGVKDLQSLEKELPAAKMEAADAEKAAKKAASEEKESSSILARTESQLQAAEKENADRLRIAAELEKYDRNRIEKADSEAKRLTEELSSALAKHSAEKMEDEKNLKELESHFGKCPVCEKELDEALRERLISERKAKVKELESKITESAKLLERNRKEHESLSKDLVKISQLQDRLKEYEKTAENIGKLSKALSEETARNEKLLKESEESDKRFQSCKEKTSKLESEREISATRERYAKEFKDASVSIADKEEQLKKMPVDKETIDRLHKEITEINSEIGRTESEFQSSSRYATDKERQHKEKLEQLSAILRIKEGISKKKQLSENLAKFNDALGETQAQLRSYLINSINKVMSDIWPELYPYKDYNDIMLEADEEDYLLKVNTLIREKLSWEEVESIASGGERSTACLAMRIAFSLVLAPNIKWLILDEPTHNLDQQAVSKLVDIFGEILPRMIDQVFIITHDEQLKGVREGTVYLLNRDKNQDRETEAVSA